MKKDQFYICPIISPVTKYTEDLKVQAKAVILTVVYGNTKSY